MLAIETEKPQNDNHEIVTLVLFKAYIEDAVTKKNRIKAENFCIEKVQGGKDPENYQVIIPKSIRRLD